MDNSRQVDFVDILPTVAALFGSDVPDECESVSIPNGQTNRPRISERIGTDYYNVSGEKGGWRGIFTCEENHPNQPGVDALENVVREEYHSMQSIRRVYFGDKAVAIDAEVKADLPETAREFLTASTAKGGAELTRPSDETRSQLQDLGISSSSRPG